MSRICLLSPVNPWVNPRLVKEADALLEAGHDVVVGFRNASRAQAERDAPLLARKQWTYKRFDYSRADAPLRWFAGASVQRAAQEAVMRGMHSPRLDAEAYCRGHSEMRSWAIAQRADFYIAHTQPAISAAAEAAAAAGVPFAFDCEDLLADEAADGLRRPWIRDAILRIERRYLPQAAYVSATSRAMEDHLIRQYRPRETIVLHNCFPLSELEGIPAPASRATHERPRLVWMSATLGPGRGLEDIIGILPRFAGELELHLHANLPETFRAWYEDLVRELPEALRPHLHALPPGAEVMRVLADYDIGLTLDLNDCLNRSLTICNKVFLYLQAGLATLATRTPGHEEVIGEDLGALYSPGNLDELSVCLRRYLHQPELRRAKQSAWEIGQKQYNWDVEKKIFLAAVDRAIEGRNEEAGRRRSTTSSAA